MQEDIVLKRRIPTQSRAQGTIADLFEATAQLLETGTPERLTTNHVADRSGYSIGTLYRYFPNKFALLRAMASHELDAQETKVLASLKRIRTAACTEQVVRIFIRAALNPFAGRHRVHAGVLRLLATDTGSHLAPDTPPNDRAQRLNKALSSMPSAVPLGVSSETKFMMIHAITGAIEGALRSKPELVASRELEDQMVGLVLHFLEADNCCGSSPAATNPGLGSN